MELSSVNHKLYETTEAAQAQFSSNNKDLDALNTSGTIQDYGVDSAGGENVQCRHKNDAPTRYEKLKAQEQPLIQEVRELRREVQDLRREDQAMQDEIHSMQEQMYMVMDYHIATNAIEGLCVKMWYQISSQDRARLEGLHISNLQQLRLARFPPLACAPMTMKNTTAHQIYSTIQSNYRDTLQKIYDIKRRCEEQRTSVPHSKVSVADWREFVDAEFGGRMSAAVRTLLTDLETMAIWNEDGNWKRLFSE